ncbi:MAG: hypothetical protein A2287_01675 [Candidatus Melainabacteria bacterium RIFOXYA12_FULL_32_12]|nr:MAG: hypothetical protein A2255_04065 [Candidatus Melainabacteria bacterium RIFOXYA2_FULL_32_9]OGI27217.1 MAG: hypothetical protein A2287_01675 [Candidatus Melainabacteria bacterium RIFOXYA12_FULL_32_12]
MFLYKCEDKIGTSENLLVKGAEGGEIIVDLVSFSQFKQQHNYGVKRPLSEMRTEEKLFKSQSNSSFPISSKSISPTTDDVINGSYLKARNELIEELKKRNQFRE